MWDCLRRLGQCLTISLIRGQVTDCGSVAGLVSPMHGGLLRSAPCSQSRDRKEVGHMNRPILINFEVLVTNEKEAAYVENIADTLYAYGLIDKDQHITILAQCEDLPY